MLALGVAVLAVAAIGLLALPQGAPGPGRRAALLVIAASAAGSHAVARTEYRTMLLAAVALHQAGAALPVPPPLLHAFARDAGTAPLAAPSPVV